MEKTRSWPHSPRGDREISQEQTLKKGECVVVAMIVW